MITLRTTDIRASLLILVNEAILVNKSPDLKISRAIKHLQDALQYAYRKGHNVHMDILRAHASDIAILANTLPDNFYYKNHCLTMVHQAQSPELFDSYKYASL